jgi:hypothetical protein
MRGCRVGLHACGHGPLLSDINARSDLAAFPKPYVSVASPITGFCILDPDQRALVCAILTNLRHVKNAGAILMKV